MRCAGGVTPGMMTPRQRAASGPRGRGTAADVRAPTASPLPRQAEGRHGQAAENRCLAAAAADTESLKQLRMLKCGVFSTTAICMKEAPQERP